MHQHNLRAPRWRAIARCSLTAVALAAFGPRIASATAPGTRPSPAAAAYTVVDPVRPVTPDSLFGRSGKLRFRLFSSSHLFSLPILDRLFGNGVVPDRPGVFHAAEDIMGRPFAFISLIPFAAKDGGAVGDYRVGYWPGERRRTRSQAYENPEGFIEVTAENQDTYVSEHFRLRDFLTKDQHDVWPKYLVLRIDLLDKLELVISELEEQGIPVERMVVMSGFRTPQYNARGVGKGRVKDSRHQFGDAADVFVDNDGNGRMDDLNRDGRIDTRDVSVIAAAVDRVERKHPDLAGGVGRYRATRAHGPFAHIDVRGHRARWG